MSEEFTRRVLGGPTRDKVPLGRSCRVYECGTTVPRSDTCDVEGLR